MKCLITLLVLLVTKITFAAGGGAHGSVTDLLYPAVNFFILFFALLFLLKKPLREMFDKNAEDVTNLYEYADKRDKEAKIKLEMFQKKIENLESEKKKIIQNAEKEANDFVQRTKLESEEYLKRLERDSESKVLHEKSSLENRLKEDLVTEVIEKAKEKIKNDSGLNKKATNKLISQI
ncbi:MAG: hypothetical protein K9K67_02200 [Bacteriovoracaceae bacterium]|nr:hypothetical protein [Bacteriovoracaceae bacterium]